MNEYEIAEMEQNNEIQMSLTPQMISNLSTLLNAIQEVRFENNVLHVKTNKNILIEHDGHVVTMASGYNIIIGKEIHLNPNTQINEDSFDKIEHILES